MENRNSKCTLRDLLFYCYKDSLLPELFEFLGEDLGLEFIKIFGGMKIEIPSQKRALELDRNVDIYESLTLDPAQSTVLRLSDRYEITRTRVREIFRAMDVEYPRIMKFMEKIENKKIVGITTIRSPRHAEESENTAATQNKVGARKNVSTEKPKRAGQKN